MIDLLFDIDKSVSLLAEPASGRLFLSLSTEWDMKTCWGEKFQGILAFRENYGHTEVESATVGCYIKICCMKYERRSSWQTLFLICAEKYFYKPYLKIQRQILLQRWNLQYNSSKFLANAAQWEQKLKTGLNRSPINGDVYFAEASHREVQGARTDA